jgi:photosystem II stability/assembly factor-like uncharacterized protein
MIEMEIRCHASRRRGTAPALTAKGRPKARTARGARAALSALIAAVAGSFAAPGLALAAATPTPAPYPSAIGNELPLWIAVSPLYATTGLVLEMSSPQTQCQQDCVHLWRSLDGGYTWERLHPTGWSQGNFVITADAAGRETVYTNAGSAMLKSTDKGQTWTSTGPGGTPAAVPSGGGAVGVAVPSGNDYVLQPTGAQTSVPGSRKGGVDLGFAYSPSFPSTAGSYSPALLLSENSSSGALMVFRCDTSLSCTTPTVVGSASTGMTAPSSRLYPAGDYAASGSVFLFTQRGLLKSINGGATFTPLTVVSSSDPQTTTATPMMALAPGYTETGPIRTVYVAVLQAYVPTTADKNNPPRTSGGIYRSQDGGATWSSRGANGSIFHGASAVAVAPDGRLFAGWTDGQGHAGIVCSRDGGGNWGQRCPSVVNRPGSQAGPNAGAQNNTAQGACLTGCAAAGEGTGNTADIGRTSGGNQAADGLHAVGAHSVVGSGPARAGFVLAGVAILLAALALTVRLIGARRTRRADGDASD